MAKVKVRQLPARQRIRRALLLVSFLAVPITLFCFSPYLIQMAAVQGVANGSPTWAVTTRQQCQQRRNGQ